MYQLSDKFLLGTLKDKLLNVSTEIQAKRHMDESILKQVVSGDLIQADVKHKAPFTFRPVAKHIFSMNEIPLVNDSTYGFARRLIVVKFNQTFTDHKEDRHLEGRLERELPGILNWALVGLSRVLQTDCIAESEQMKEDKKDFLKSISPVVTFVEENCKLDEKSAIRKKDLYGEYNTYCKDSGLKPLSKIKFYQQMLSDYPAIMESRPDGGARCFSGISLSKED